MYKMHDGTPFIIREAREEDAKALLEFVHLSSTESDNLTFGKGEFDMTVEDEIKFIKSVSLNDNAVMILALVGDKVISSSSYTAGRRSRISHVGEFGISVSKKYWRQGVGRAVLKELIKWCEDNPKCEKLNLRVREDNLGAIALYESLGFEKEGLLLRDMKINGQFVNCYFMGKSI